MELLSPAGNIASAYAAFKGGADAVYIGGKQFSARASADNFTDDEIKEIVFFAHSIGKKIYVTVNTLLFQDEFFEAVEFCKFLYSINIDGVIIQDLGLAHYLHNVLPDLPLNASTQLNCHNIRQAEALVKLGFKRVVLARESNLDFVRKVKNLGVEVEVFGHGALCVSYSGNCLLSSFIGDRSGNRGKCAQPCRMRYDLLEDNKTVKPGYFAISTKDLMTLDYLNAFVEAGVDSLKIEGRLKSNEYIYAVSKAYRHALDAVYESKENKNSKIDKDELIKIFNRQFTKGFVLSESQFAVLNTGTSSHQGVSIGKVIKVNKNRVTIQLHSSLHRLDGIRFNNKEQIGFTVEKMFKNSNPVEEAFSKDIIDIAGVEKADRLLNCEVIKTKDYALSKRIEDELKKSIKVPVTGTFYAHLNEPISLSVTFNNKTVTVKSNVPQEASGSGTSEQRVIEQLNKSGAYPYTFEFLDVNLERCFIPISEINELRNKAFEELKNSLIEINEVVLQPYISELEPQERIQKNVGFAMNIDQNDIMSQYGFESFADFDKYFVNENRVTSKTSFSAPKEILHFAIIRKEHNYLVASHYCNITNSYALDAYYSLGFNECLMSVECDYSSIQDLIYDFKNRHNFLPNVGMLIYGKIDMMIMRSCPIGNVYGNKGIHCNRCHNHKYELNDRMNERYWLIGDSECNTKIINNRPIYLIDREQELRDFGIESMYFAFTDENNQTITRIIEEYFEGKGKFLRFEHTRGHYQKRPL